MGPPEDTPPILVFCRASFILQYDAVYSVGTEPILFTVANGNYAVTVKEGRKLQKPDAIQSLLDTLNGFQGKKSAKVQELIHDLESALK